MRASTGTPLYVHLPFCVVKCPYCDFYSVEGEGEDTGSLVAAILKEAEIRAPRAPRSVFFGGGTPSYLSIPELELLFDRLDALTGFRSAQAEVTVECNPESLTPDKARALVDLGATRLSIGFQSLRAETLALFGRAHSARDAFAAYDAARAAGVRAVSVDLIYAAPGQTVDAWCEDLERVLALGPEHLSAYNLTFEPGTPFWTRLQAGELEPLSEDVELELFHATRERTREAGLAAYEVSNFATKGHQCRHNVGYWRNGPYVGLGPSAVSRVGEDRFGNPRSLGGWRKKVEAGLEPRSWSERLDPPARLGETWWLGLRLAEGVDPAQARATSGIRDGAPDDALPTARELVASGHLSLADGRFRLTPLGLPLADAVARRFLVSPAPKQ